MTQQEFNAISTTGANDAQFDAINAYYEAADNLDKEELAKAWDKRDPIAWAIVIVGGKLQRAQEANATLRKEKALIVNDARETAIKVEIIKKVAELL